MYTVTTLKDLLSYCILHAFHGRRRRYMYRLYTKVKVYIGFIKPRDEGTRFDKSVDKSEPY